MAIADHNTVGGGMAAFMSNTDPDFIVIPGAEYSTEYGHVVGLFLSEEIRVQGRKPQGYTLSPTLPFEDVVQAIHAQGGIAVLAHPFQSRVSLPAHVFKGPVKVDAIEGFNSRAGAGQSECQCPCRKLFRPSTTCLRLEAATPTCLGR